MDTSKILTAMEFRISAAAAAQCKFEQLSFSSCGNSVFDTISSLQKFVFHFNTCVKNGSFGTNQNYIQAGELNAAVLLNGIFKYVLTVYYTKVEKNFFQKGYEFIDNELKKQNLHGIDFLLEEFCKTFPPNSVYQRKTTAKKWLEEIDKDSGRINKLIALEEFILLNLTNINPANEQFSVLFRSEHLKTIDSYNTFWKTALLWSKKNKPFAADGTDVLSMLTAPIEHSPYNLKGQLEFIKNNWGKFISVFLTRILTAEDLISEEQKAGWSPPSANFDVPVYTFENLLKEYERFTPDRNWMPNVVLIAKSTLVWLDQLSKKYSASITRLDQIPNEELQFLFESGINALWLIGIWRRSDASRKIKQICGNQDAAASAYSLYDYDISEELGGWSALEDLRVRASRYGIRLAADMVPNHTGIDSKWIAEKPELFLQCAVPPFPSYNFTGENLSCDARTDIYIENGYYSKTDCAVVFKRKDNNTGDVRYIYHGNDGTGLPWNDTAQINFLNAEAREAVIQKIIYVAKHFPIIRFDAAMVLTKKHIRRLWYPAPGSGGDIASRSAYSMSVEEFEKKIPEEFWREVVNRCAEEAPETLLLAEAFWMMEGYFVRTLGMHRVYNSAFMNMLKKEENAKYRETIKNTLEFDPEILKRYVNFMNNPDEETAVMQFGMSDKYFGVCTMMCTMPGLPMFGHGQIEGFEEKYGMEFRRAYKNETENTELIERHKREIFPLLRNRYIFSGVKNFRLFDFWNNGIVNENVFVWTNVFNEEKSLIFYNNSYERAAGFIKTSAALAVKNNNGEKILLQTELADALKLKIRENYFTVFWEQRSKLFFLRKNSELALSGFFAILNGYQTQVFLNIYEVEDIDGSYKKLYETLNGNGVQNIERELKKITLKDLYSALQAFLTQNYFIELLKIKTECAQVKNGKEKCNLIFSFLNKTEMEYTLFFKCVVQYTISTDKNNAVNIEKIIYTFKNYVKCFLFISSFHDKFNFTADTESLFFSDNEIWYAYFAFIICAALSAVIPYAVIASLGIPDEITQVFIKENFNKAARFFNEAIPILEPLTVHKNNLKIETINSDSAGKDILKLSKFKSAEIIRNWFLNAKVKTYLCVHEWGGISWFNKERVETLIFVEVFFAFTKEDGDICSVKNAEALFSSLHQFISASEYKTEKLLRQISSVL